MADRYLLESGSPDGYLLEDGTGVLSLDNSAEITNNANTTVTYQGASTYRIEKTGGTGGVYDASAVSSVGYSGDFVLQIAHITNAGNYGAGVNSDPLTDNSYTSIDYLWLHGGGQWFIYESGADAGEPSKAEATYAWIWRTGTTLYYGRGATLATAQASPDRTVTSVTSTLYFDSTFTTVGDKLDANIYSTATTTDLTPSLFTNSQTFYAPTVTTANPLTPSLFTNSQTFYGPTITTGPVDLAPSLFTNTQTFHGPTLSTTYALTPGLFTNSQTFYGPTVTPGAVGLTPSLFTNSQTLYAPAASATYALTPDLFTNSQSFYSPTVAAAYDLAASLFTNAQTFYAPTVEQLDNSQELEPSLLTNTQTFYGPTLGTSNAISTPLLTNEQAFYTATLTAYASLAEIRRYRNRYTKSAGRVGP